MQNYLIRAKGQGRFLGASDLTERNRELILSLERALSGLVKCAFVKLGQGSSLAPHSLEQLDLTPTRYDTFLKEMGSSSELQDCLSVLNLMYGSFYCPETMLKLTADFVFKATKDGENEFTKSFEQRFQDFVRDLQQEHWNLVGYAPLYNLEPPWEVERDISFPIMRDINLFTGNDTECHNNDIKEESPVWCEIDYVVPKTGQEYAASVDPPTAAKRLQRLLLGMRLFNSGDVGTDTILCKVAWRPYWPWVRMGLNLRVPPAAEFEAYEIPDEHALSLLGAFSRQIDAILEIPHAHSIDVGCEDFLASYSRDPVDRLEGLLRALQALFMNRGDPSWMLSKRVAAFLARDSEHFVLIEQRVRESYDIRSRVSHGNVPPSALEKWALDNLLDLEEYCRRSIFFQLGLERRGALGSVLQKLDRGIDPAQMRQEKGQANIAFWKDSQVVFRDAKGRRVLPILWKEEII